MVAGQDQRALLQSPVLPSSSLGPEWGGLHPSPAPHSGAEFLVQFRSVMANELEWGAPLRWMEGGDSAQWGSGDRGGPSGAWCRLLGGRAVGAVLGVAAFPMWENFSPLLCILTTVNLCPCFLDLSSSIGTQLNMEVTQTEGGGASRQRRGEWEGRKEPATGRKRAE